MDEEDKPKKQVRKIKNSDIIKRTLISLVNVASSKTSEEYAWSSVKKLLKESEEKYIFLKYVHMTDIECLKNATYDITVMSDINNIESGKIGSALSDIIKMMNSELGKDAGHFFVKEVKENLEEDFNENFEDMGLDLGLIQLEHEVRELGKKIRK